MQRKELLVGKSLIDLEGYPVKSMLPLLLKDNTTTKRVGGTLNAKGRLTGFKVVPKNILWATNTYKDHGRLYDAESQITEDLIVGPKRGIIQPRVYKSQEDQAERTRKHAEVFTPTWICCKMNDALDEDWFGCKDVFFKQEGQTWTPTEGKIEFPKKKTWKQYIDSRRLEITCGEAPFLVSRYDAATGEAIEQTHRIGILDRKLRVVSENTETEDEWMQWCIRAFQSVYGYEYQGDNLLVARINLLMTFVDAVENRWGRKPTNKELRTISTIIAWNLWQMDGLKGTVPFRAPEDNYEQMDMDEFAPHPEQMCFDEGVPETEKPKCKVNDWRSQRSIEYNSLQERVSSMRFDYVIGNPPYQEDNQNNHRQSPVYNIFMDESYKVADCVEMITPARFLFEAGQTPKEWNKKMLSDEHFKVLFYNKNGSEIFSNADIKGGIAITLRNINKSYGAMGIFVENEQLNSILHKVSQITHATLDSIAYPKSNYGLTEQLYTDNPTLKNRLTCGNDYIVDASIFQKMPEIFYEESGDGLICVYGRENSRRVCKYVKEEYIKDSRGVFDYKVFVPGANGSGKFGETLSAPFVGGPREIGTQTYMSFGFFEDEYSANNLLKYIKTKFARCLLGVLKVTQNNPKSTWSKIPLQDFTPNSDIDWSQSVADIDKQLYKKYGLNQQEIDFIETHVKEMV